NLYFKRWFILCPVVMWQIENAVTDVLALDIDSGFLCNGRPCTCPVMLCHEFHDWRYTSERVTGLIPGFVRRKIEEGKER
ncbi:MAG: hypothetical protein Q8S00_27965, partial [Deltaproteobacteria bacterium]|nr:hypothetical protein [Deltaproteobacteria bacterium]